MAYDPVKAAEYATKAMHATSQSECAYYVRKAINAGGIPGSWGHAYQYLEKGSDGLNPLERMGFSLIDHNQGLQVGDIGVLNATKDHKYGHIQMWNGKQWVSDFGQNAAKMGPYAAYADGIAPGQTLRVFRYGAPAALVSTNPGMSVEDVFNGLIKTGSTNPRGIRNNNPGNLRYSDRNDWQGQTGKDPDFSIFEDPIYGIRAMARTVSNKQGNNGYITLNDLLNAYASPSVDDINSYIKAVSKLSGFAPDERINLRDANTLFKVIAPMIQVENGYNPYSIDQMMHGIDLGLNMGKPVSIQPSGLSNITQKLANSSESTMPTFNPKGIQSYAPQGNSSFNIWEDLNRSFKYFEPMKPTLNLEQGLFGEGLKDINGNVMANPFSHLFRRV